MSQLAEWYKPGDDKSMTEGIRPTTPQDGIPEVNAILFAVRKQRHNQGKNVGHLDLGWASIEIARRMFLEAQPWNSYARFRAAKDALAAARTAGHLRLASELEEQLPALRQEALTVLRAQIDDVRDQWRSQNPGQAEALTEETLKAYYQLPD